MSLSSYPEKSVFFQEEIVKKISLQKEFKLERKTMRSLPIDHPEQVYLSDEQQVPCLIDVSKEHLFYDIWLDYLNGEYNFVLTCEESPRILCDKTLHHSYLANGKKVLACGTLVFKQGTLIEITNNSGHYKPTDEEMLSFIKDLYAVSGKTLLNYISYCTSEPGIYSVAELENSDDFTSAVPLAERVVSNTSENLSVISRAQEDEKEPLRLINSVYDENIVANRVHASAPIQQEKHTEANKFSERRFGKNMSESLITKYKKLLGGNSFFQIPEGQAEKDTSPLNVAFQ